jgi:serpin B
VAISPLVVSNVLVQAWASARGETAAQIQSVLRAEGDSARALQSFAKFTDELGNPSRKHVFRAATRLFIEKTQVSEAGDPKQVESGLSGEVEPVDLVSAPEASRRRVNDWIASQTQQSIRDLVPPGTITPMTVMVIASGAYFSSNWLMRFSERYTWEDSFYRTPADHKDVPMMHTDAWVRYASVDGVSVVEMLYEGGEVAMTLALPEERAEFDALAKVEARLSLATLDGWIAALRKTAMSLSLPRFTINTYLPLRASLQAMGMSLAFDGARADFTNIGRRGVHVDELFHKVRLEVNEAGTTGSAGGSLTEALAAPPEFRADRPFLFFIREVRSGLILFMGRVSDPAAT